MIMESTIDAPSPRRLTKPTLCRCRLVVLIADTTN